MIDKEIVMFDAHDSITYKTVSGWVSVKDGLFFGKDERAARYHACTHLLCADCKKVVVPKYSYTICDGCRSLRDIEKYEKMPKKVLQDFDAPIYSDYTDRYYFNGELWDDVEDDIYDDGSDEGIKLEDLRLIHCEPRYLHQLDSSTWEDSLSTEDDYAELPKEVEDALDALNAAIAKAGPVSWEPGKYAVELPVNTAK